MSALANSYSAAPKGVQRISEIERSTWAAQGRAKPRRRDTGEEYFGQARESEIEKICIRATEYGLCGAIALGIWAAIIARAGGRERLEGDAAPSISGLAKQLGIDRSTLSRYLETIEKTGLILIERPPGRKPQWLIRSTRPVGGDLSRMTASEAVGNSDWGEAGGGAHAGTPCSTRRRLPPLKTAPAPHRKKEAERKKKEAGDGELWKLEELPNLCDRFSAHLVTLIGKDPDSLEVEMLEGLAAEAGDNCEHWRALVDLAALQANGEELKV